MSTPVHASTSRRDVTITHLLLACGVAYLVLYILANDAVAAPIYNGYSRMDQAISELSARGAESRPFLVVVSPVFSALMIACGVGVWRAALGSHRLQALGATLMAWGASHVAWLWYPMTPRAEIAAAGSTGTNDVGHIVLTVLTFAFILTVITLGALSFGRRFRWYSIGTAIVILVAGGIVGAMSAGLAEGNATPWMGLIERISAYGMMAYVAAVAVGLWRRTGKPEVTVERTRELSHAA
jgi:phage terminase large subunit-like protein